MATSHGGIGGGLLDLSCRPSPGKDSAVSGLSRESTPGRITESTHASYPPVIKGEPHVVSMKSTSLLNKANLVQIVNSAHHINIFSCSETKS